MIDLIDRESLVETIKQNYCDNCRSLNGTRCRTCHILGTLAFIEASPSMTAKTVDNGHCPCGGYKEDAND